MTVNRIALATIGAVQPQPQAAPTTVTETVHETPAAGPGDDPAPCTADDISPQQASMYVSYPSAAGETDDCSGPISAQVRLPRDEQPFKVETPATMETMPPLCHGPISVSPFAYGGFE